MAQHIKYSFMVFWSSKNTKSCADGAAQPIAYFVKLLRDGP